MQTITIILAIYAGLSGLAGVLLGAWITWRCLKTDTPMLLKDVKDLPTSPDEDFEDMKLEPGKGTLDDPLL